MVVLACQVFGSKAIFGGVLEHRFFLDAVNQFSAPRIFVTITPYEWCFPVPPWLSSIRDLTGKGSTQLAAFEMSHITHGLEQIICRYLCGSNDKKWSTMHSFIKIFLLLLIKKIEVHPNSPGPCGMSWGLLQSVATSNQKSSSCPVFLTNRRTYRQSPADEILGIFQIRSQRFPSDKKRQTIPSPWNLPPSC